MKNNYNNVNTNKLYDELVKAGITPILVESDLEVGQYIAKNTWITFAEDVDNTKVDAVVASHNPIPIITPSEADRLASVESMITMLMGV